MIEHGKIDLHMHSTVSDGTDSPQELLDRVIEAGISLFSLTDHDAIKGCEWIRSRLLCSDCQTPVFITGVEFSCRDEEGQYHILGYDYDPKKPSIRSVVEQGHELRVHKVCERLGFIEKEYGFTFPKEEIDTLLSMDNPGKPHIANLMVKYGYAKTKEQAIKGYINHLHLPNDYVLPQDAIEGILASGGIPVLAHPFFGDGDQLLSNEEMESRLQRLIRYGLAGVEAFYSGFSPKLTEQMLAFSDRYDLYVTAGSDYHGTNKLIKLGDTRMDQSEMLPPKMQTFIQRVTKTKPIKSDDHEER